MNEFSTERQAIECETSKFEKSPAEIGDYVVIKRQGLDGLHGTVCDKRIDYNPPFVVGRENTKTSNHIEVVLVRLDKRNWIVGVVEGEFKFILK